jgi:16S rRNA (adenine1518-N6/adenine1519-N6)-dimethyltransferase
MHERPLFCEAAPLPYDAGEEEPQLRSLPVRGPSRPSRHKPKLGQNFLISTTAPRALVEALGDLSQATVLEIGPGKGVLTTLLAARAQHVIAVELDAALAASLQLTGDSRVEVLCQDILNLNLTQVAARQGAQLQVIGNLPYYISSPILTHLFAHSAVIDRAVLMVQREVAERIVAPPGSSDYGLLSAITQMYAEVENLFTLPPDAFEPPPKVYSTVFRLTMHSRFEELGVEPEDFLRFLRQVFAQKRKTLANNLRNSGYTELDRLFRECRVDAQVRAEAVSLEDMACLHKILKTHPPTPS